MLLLQLLSQEVRQSGIKTVGVIQIVWLLGLPYVLGLFISCNYVNHASFGIWMHAICNKVQVLLLLCLLQMCVCMRVRSTCKKPTSSCSSTSMSAFQFQSLVALISLARESTACAKLFKAPANCTVKFP